MLQVCKLPFDCQAIFLSPLADFSDPPAELVDAARAISSSSRCFASGLIGAAARQYRPGDAGELVSQGDDDDILVRPRQQPACPSAERRLAIDQVGAARLARRGSDSYEDSGCPAC